MRADVVNVGGTVTNPGKQTLHHAVLFAQLADGIRGAHMEGSVAVINAGSGTYRFVSRARPE